MPTHLPPENEHALTEAPTPRPRRSWIRRAAAWSRRPELPILVAFLTLAAALWGFGWLAEEVVEGETRAFDTHLLLALRSASDPSDPIGPVWFEQMVRDFTALGSVGVLTLVVLAVIGFLALARQRGAAFMVAASVGGGWLVTEALKRGFGRPRPDLVPHGAIVYTFSFPSSHAAMSAVVYLTLGALLARVQPQRRLKIYLVLLAILLTLIAGTSRIYLAVHWPTDVLAGWIIGAIWAVLCWLAMRWLQRRGKVETDASGAAREGGLD